MNNFHDTLKRDTFIFQNENNPQFSQMNGIWASTVLDQVFDQLHPTRRNLRDILNDLREEIRTGGIGNIQFPVTTVNGQTGDVRITAHGLGLGRVDNTADMEKPLSIPQEERVRALLQNFDFGNSNLNLQALYDHLNNMDNPHSVTFEQLNAGQEITELINLLIAAHNLSTSSNVHTDIRRNIQQLWMRVEHNDRNNTTTINNVIQDLSDHIIDPGAHIDLFLKKEDLENKISHFTEEINNNHTLYPTTRSVSDFVRDRIQNFYDGLNIPNEWLANIRVIMNVDQLPEANANNFRQVFLITNTFPSQQNTSFNLESLSGPTIVPPDIGQIRLNVDILETIESTINNIPAERNIMFIAVCRRDTDGTYFWDIRSTGAVTRFDSRFFRHTVNGLSLNFHNIFAEMINTDDTGVAGNVLSKFYTREEINAKFLRTITILPGTMDGHIRYYVNDDQQTMSTEIRIPGLRNLAFKEWITESEIRENSIHSRHIINQAIQPRHLADTVFFDGSRIGNINLNQINMDNNHILGSINNDSGTAQQITLMTLADRLRPLIGGWPDPHLPGNPWNDNINMSHRWEPHVEYEFVDGSYGMRFTGFISVLANRNFDEMLNTTRNSGNTRMTDSGGSWQISTNLGHGEWAVLGGSNLTGHTFGTIVLTNAGMRFVSMSIGDRINAPYDIWVRYLKLVDGDWPAPPPIPGPGSTSLLLSQTEISINDGELTASFEAGGSAVGEITVDRLTLPNNLDIFISGDTISVVGNRPHLGQDPIIDTFVIVVTRESVSATIRINVNLSPSNIPLLFAVNPTSVVINDNTQSANLIVTGSSTDEITFDTSELPDGININLSGSPAIIRVEGTRPPPLSDPITGIYTFKAIRESIVQVITIDISLTPIPLLTTLNPSLLYMDDNNLIHTIEVGGTSVGEITTNSNYTLPGNIHVEIDQNTGIITLIGNRPTNGNPDMNSSFVVTVSRQNASFSFRLDVNLTAL